jgi:2-polyprenyl-3-methyl-5-hydroxy-6-metoxy-1,4-benzoquinol methylase
VGDAAYCLTDHGDRRVLVVGGREYVTRYSARVIRMLIERKGVERTPPYLTYRETRGPHFLGPLVRRLRARGAHGLQALEVGCSFGHMTEYLAEQPEVVTLDTFDTDDAFVELTRVKVEELGLKVVRDVLHLDQASTCRLPWAAGAFDLVLAIGVVEHLPMRHRRQQVDEYYRVLARGGHIAILDTPNRWFPLETHSIGLPLVQWLPALLAWRYARLARSSRYGAVGFDEFVADGTGSLAECLPSSGRAGLVDVTEDAGYGFTFFRATARSRTRRALLPAFAAAAAMLRALGRPPSLALPYFNLLLRKPQ